MKKSISLKVSPQIYEKIEQERGDKGKSPFVEEILKYHFSNTQDDESNTIELLQDRIENLEEDKERLIQEKEDWKQAYGMAFQKSIEGEKKTFWDRLKFWK